jgi:N6-adenosine-specific RNA methylase IME4
MIKFASDVQLKNPTPKETMPELKINPKFRDLIPPLSEHELEALHAEIRYWARAYSPIITWNGTIIDGHHRYEICKRYNLPFTVEEKHFEIERDARKWIITNQFARRNLTDFVRGELVLSMEGILREEAEETSRANLVQFQVTDNQESTDCQNFDSRTAQEAQKDWNNSRVNAKLGKQAGISREQIRKIKKLKDSCNEDEIKELREGFVSINKKAIEKDRALRQETLKATEFPKGKYRVVYADPPWSYNDKKAPGQGGAEEQYPTMSIEDICNMKVQDITDDNAVLFLWATTPLLQEGLDVMKAWGFTYKTLFTWDKVRPFPGNYNSVMQEFLFLGTKGSCLPDIDIKPSSIVRVEKGRHSEKPEEFRELIETLYKYGNKVELFARKQSSGWDVFGNQCS